MSSRSGAKSEHQREKEEAKKAQKEADKSISGWFRKCIQSGQDWADDKHREFVAQAQFHIRPDLMEMCDVGEPDNIDYQNPHVKIAMLMVDPVNQRLAHNPRYREKLYSKMDDEMLDVWNNYVDEYGHGYKELYESRKASAKAVMYRRKMDKADRKAAKQEARLTGR